MIHYLPKDESIVENLEMGQLAFGCIQRDV